MNDLEVKLAQISKLLYELERDYDLDYVFARPTEEGVYIQAAIDGENCGQVISALIQMSQDMQRIHNREQATFNA